MADVDKPGLTVGLNAQPSRPDTRAGRPSDLDGAELDKASRHFADASEPKTGDPDKAARREDRRPDAKTRSRDDGTRHEARDKGRGRAPVARGERVLQGLHGLQELSGLQGFQGLQGLHDQVQTAPLVAHATPTNPSDMVAKLADRILVSAPDAGHPEVRIKLNMDTLQGTEIALARDAHGLSVRFDAPSSQIARLLDTALPDLKAALEQRVSEKHAGEPVRIEVQTSKAGSNADDTGDGRSRNRRDLYQELADEQEP